MAKEGWVKYAYIYNLLLLMCQDALIFGLKGMTCYHLQANTTRC